MSHPRVKWQLLVSQIVIMIYSHRKTLKSRIFLEFSELLKDHHHLLSRRVDKGRRKRKYHLQVNVEKTIQFSMGLPDQWQHLKMMGAQIFKNNLSQE
jgi:hypothetical protein